jgi:hypothetical protein
MYTYTYTAMNGNILFGERVKIRPPKCKNVIFIVCIYVYMYILTRICRSCTALYMYIHTCICRDLLQHYAHHSYIHTHTHTHTHIYAYIHTCIHTHIHTYADLMQHHTDQSSILRTQHTTIQQHTRARTHGLRLRVKSHTKQ